MLLTLYRNYNLFFSMKGFSQTDGRPGEGMDLGVGIEGVGDYIPAIVRIQDFGSKALVYINRRGCCFFNRCKEEILAMGSDYDNLFLHNEENSMMESRMQQLVKEGINGKFHSFFQRIRPHQDSDFTWFFTNASMYNPPNGQDSTRIVHFSFKLLEGNGMATRLDRLIKDESFLVQNYANFNRLSHREKEVLCLIANGSCSKDIAESLYISIHTVNNHRKNIIHKTGFRDPAEFSRFASYFDHIYPSFYPSIQHIKGTSVSGEVRKIL